VDLSGLRFSSTILFIEDDTSFHLRLIPDFQASNLDIWAVNEFGGGSITYDLSAVPKNGTTLAWDSGLEWVIELEKPYEKWIRRIKSQKLSREPVA
jgi:hypothetical protein